MIPSSSFYSVHKKIKITDENKGCTNQPAILNPCTVPPQRALNPRKTASLCVGPRARGRNCAGTQVTPRCGMRAGVFGGKDPRGGATRWGCSWAAVTLVTDAHCDPAHSTQPWGTHREQGRAEEGVAVSRAHHPAPGRLLVPLLSWPWEKLGPQCGH